MLTFLAFDAPPPSNMTRGEGILTLVIFAICILVFIIYINRRNRKYNLQQKPSVNPPKFDNYNGKTPPSVKEAVNEYVLTTVNQAVTEFRPGRKFSADDVYYKLGKRYPRDLIKQALCQLADTGDLEETWSRKGNCCFVRFKSA